MAEPSEAPGSIWNHQDEDAEPMSGAAENSDDAAGDNEGDTKPSSDELDPALAAKLAKLMAAREDELAKAIESGDTNNKVYKGLQRSIAGKDKQIDALQTQLQETLARMQQFEEHFEGAVEGLNWLSSTTLEALPEDVRERASNNLSKRQADLAKKQFEAAQKRVADAPAKQPPRATVNDDEVPEWVKERVQKFLNVARKSATRSGIDPDDKRLDYGSDKEGMVERLEHFEESLGKALEDADEQRTEAVRQKTKPPATRSSGGGSAPATFAGSGKSTLEQGSMERLAAIRGGKFDR